VNLSRDPTLADDEYLRTTSDLAAEDIRRTLMPGKTIADATAHKEACEGALRSRQSQSRL
jgi:hypothetical protein